MRIEDKLSIKISERSGNFAGNLGTLQATWKLPIPSGNFPGQLDTFQTILKLPRTPGKFPGHLESFQRIGNFPGHLETSQASWKLCSHLKTFQNTWKFTGYLQAIYRPSINTQGLIPLSVNNSGSSETFQAICGIDTEKKYSAEAEKPRQ